MKTYIVVDPINSNDLDDVNDPNVFLVVVVVTVAVVGSEKAFTTSRSSIRQQPARSTRRRTAIEKGKA
jgi:hypothetical protein